MELLNYQIKEEMRMLIREEMALVAPIIEMTPAPKELVNQKVFCKRFDLSEPTVIRWRNKGLIPYVKIGSAIRYDVNEVAKVLQSRNKKRA